VTPKLLANENIPAPSIAVLREAGFDVLPIAETADGITDREVLARAVAENRWILTFDRIYGELLDARGLSAPPAVFLFRLKSYRPDAPGRLVVELVESGLEIEGGFLVCDDNGVRRRPLPNPE
jgi:predicted nuclease of predicted toxin-antitoxin system